MAHLSELKNTISILTTNFIWISPVVLLMFFDYSRIQSMIPHCIKSSCFPSLLWSMIVSQCSLVFYNLENSGRVFCRMSLSLGLYDGVFSGLYQSDRF